MTFNLRKVVLAASAVVLAVALAGCSTYTHAEAESHSFSVLQTRNGNLFQSDEFSYIDREGQMKAFEPCSRGTVFTQASCHNESGTVTFNYTSRKGRISKASITVDGEKIDLTCARDAESTSLRICLPV